MSRLAILACAALVSISANAQSPQEGLSLLFKNVGKQLSLHDKAVIFQQLDLKIGEDGKKLVDSTCDFVEFEAEVELVDLNNDKIPEVFVSGGNTCTSGIAGASIWLFVKDRKGQYYKNLGFPAGGYQILKSSNKGFPDLTLGGPGFCEPVWRWNGSKYSYLRSQSTAKGGCDMVFEMQQRKKKAASVGGG